METAEAALAISAPTESPILTRAALTATWYSPLPIFRAMPSPIPTRAALTAAAESGAAEQNRDGWQHLIDYQLLEWGRDPSVLVDEDIPAPTPATIRRACQVASACRDRDLAPPQRVCTDGEGGIVFERGAGAVFNTIQVTAGGEIVRSVFVDSRLRRRERIG